MAKTWTKSAAAVLKIGGPGVLAALLVIAAARLFHAQTINELYGTETFHQAYYEAGEISFVPFDELHWEAYARKALAWLNLDHPTREQIARLSTFEPAGPQYRSIDFHAPLDPAVPRRSYLLIHAGGVAPIQPVQLHGSLQFSFDAGIKEVLERNVSGRVVAKGARPLTTAAFAVMGTPSDVRDVRAGVNFAKRKGTGPAVYEFSDGGRMVAWTAGKTEKPDPASAVSFRLAGQHLLLVKWNGDFCGVSYTLFSVGSALKPIAGNDYECDP